MLLFIESEKFTKKTGIFFPPFFRGKIKSDKSMDGRIDGSILGSRRFPDEKGVPPFPRFDEIKNGESGGTTRSSSGYGPACFRKSGIISRRRI